MDQPALPPPKVTCPACKLKKEAEPPPGESEMERPGAGDFWLCSRCGVICRFDAEAKLRLVADLTELQDLEPEHRRALLQKQAEVQAAADRRGRA